VLIRSEFLSTHLGEDFGHVLADLLGLFLVKGLHPDQPAVQGHEEQHPGVPTGHRRPGPIDPQHSHPNSGRLSMQIARPLTGRCYISLDAAFAPATVQQRQESLHSPVAQAQHVQHHADSLQPPGPVMARQNPVAPQRPRRAAPGTLHPTLRDRLNLQIADGPAPQSRMNSAIIPPAVRTTTLKLENPFSRWQDVVDHLGLLAVDGVIHLSHRQRGLLFHTSSTRHGTVT